MAKSDTKYIYSGPLTGVTLKPDKEGEKPREVMLHPGAEVSLPAENPYVKTLVAQKFLTEVVVEEAPVQAQPKPQAQKNKEDSSAS